MLDSALDVLEELVFDEEADYLPDVKTDVFGGIKRYILNHVSRRRA